MRPKKNLKNFIVSKTKLGFLLITYFFALQYLYQFEVAPLFAYQGLIDSFSLNKFFISIFLLIMVSISTRQSYRPSDFFIILATALIIIPSLVVYSGANLPNKYIWITLTAFFLMTIFARFSFLKKIKIKSINSRFLVVILTSIAILTLSGIVVFGGLRFISFSIADVYENRRDAANSLPGVFGYLNSIVPKVIIPFAMILALLDRRWLLMGFIGSFCILFFILTSHKSPLLYPIVVLFFYFSAKSKKIGQYLLLIIIFVVMVSIADFWYLDKFHEKWSGWFGSILGRRALLVPSLLNWDYINIFSDIEKYYWSQSKLSLGLVDQPYDVSASNLIGELIFNNPQMSANTGWIGSGYSNAGIWGVALYSILIGLLFSFLDRYGEKVGNRLVIATFTLPVLTMLTSTDLSNIFLNHGLIFAILILTVIPTSENKFKYGAY